ncbi:MAG TPA: c-type cytochrome [Thermoanaerobaculia bacterium]|jgi:mono/diheme cytochrome c family protein
MRKLTLILALAALMGCNRDRVATNDHSGANERVVPTDSMVTTAAAETSTLVPVGGVPAGGTTETSAATITSHTPDAGTTTRTITGEPPKDTAPAPTGDIAAGQGVYRAQCASCHGADGKTATGLFTLASAATQQRADAELVRVIRDSPSHKALRLESAQLSAVVAYVKALQ